MRGRDAEERSEQMLMLEAKAGHIEAENQALKAAGAAKARDLMVAREEVMRLKTSSRRGELEGQVNRAKEEVDRLRAVGVDLSHKLQHAEDQLGRLKAPEGVQHQLVLAREEILVLEQEVAARDRSLLQGQHRMGVLAQQVLFAVPPSSLECSPSNGRLAGPVLTHTSRCAAPVAKGADDVDEDRVRVRPHLRLRRDGRVEEGIAGCDGAQVSPPKP